MAFASYTTSWDTTQKSVGGPVSSIYHLDSEQAANPYWS